MKSRPDWAVEGRDWPNRAASRWVEAAGFTWHVQIMGAGPPLLLLHGTGAATHSWRDLAPLLSQVFTVIAPDLPGHGFSELPSRRRQTLNGMSASLARLVRTLGLAPVAVAGHSAGAAIALRMALDGAITPRAIVSLNGALTPFPGMGGIIFPALAKLMFLNPLAAPIMVQRAKDPAAVARLIEGTGSHLDPRGLALYGSLLRTTRHIEATLAMMANWDLKPLQRDMPRLGTPVTLVAAEGDIAVPPRTAREAKSRLPNATIVSLPGWGHLAHEEAPAACFEIIRDACV